MPYVLFDDLESFDTWHQSYLDANGYPIQCRDSQGNLVDEYVTAYTVAQEHPGADPRCIADIGSEVQPLPGPTVSGDEAQEFFPPPEPPAF